MADDLAKKETDSDPDIAALGLLSKAEEFYWMLKMAAVVLFVDFALMLTRQRNILSFPWGDTEWENEVGPIIVLGLCYSLLVSALLPLLEAFVERCVRHVYFVWLGGFGVTREARTRSRNLVTCWELEAQADKEQSDYLLAKVKAARARTERVNEENSRTGRYAFRLLVLLVLNFALTNSGAPSALIQLPVPLSAEVRAAIVVLVLFSLSMVCCRSWCRDWFPTRWIRYAPLYEEIQKLEKESRERERELVRKYGA